MRTGTPRKNNSIAYTCLICGVFFFFSFFFFFFYREPRLITATLGGTVHVWDGRTGVEEQQLHGHSDAVNAFVITPDGQAIVTAGEDHVCLVFRL